jgi:starch phosphorylase
MAGKRKDLSFLTAFDLGMDRKAIALSFANHVEYALGKDQFSATARDYFLGTALSVRARLLDRWNKTQQDYYNRDLKRVYYLSLEFLVGRLLEDSLINLGILEETRTALAELGLSLDEILEQEGDAGLGNGGLGRLAACFLDSMATLGIPAMGYGIRYEYGIFRQVIADGQQMEHPDC